MESETEGCTFVMVTEQYPRIGGCRTDKTLFYLGSTSGLCPFCAQPPHFVANLPVATEPFAPVDWNGGPDDAAPQADAGAVEGMPSAHNPEATTAPADPVELPANCPACNAALRAVVSDEVFSLLLAAPAAEDAAPAAEDAPPPAADDAPATEGAVEPAEAPPVTGPVSAGEPTAPSGADAEAPVA
jgi:hypothetical protein